MKTVAVMIDGYRTVHMHSPNGNYATMCGLDGNDSECGQLPAASKRGDKINCPDCKSIWIGAREYRSSDFEEQP